MQQIKAIVADNDESLTKHLESLLSEVWPELVVCGRATNGPQALALMEEHKPHIAFLEIRLPGICGMEVARNTSASCWVVFITAYDHYAVNAFETGAVDYLVKPVGRERLEKAVGRLKKQIAVSSSPPAHRSRVVEQLIEGLLAV